MSTREDFENAPIGATASGPDGRVAVKTPHKEWPWSLFDEGGERVAHGSHHHMATQGYQLDQLPYRPTSAREALDLAWELAHPVKEGQFIPVGTRYVSGSRGCGLATFTASMGWKPSPWNAENIRTLDPLPEPEPELPDWLDAPAVLAWSRWDDVRREKVWSKADECYKNTDGETIDWSNLRDVTPLYPKEDA